MSQDQVRTVTLDGAAPAISQPSPYSDSADQPIPYALTDDVQILADRSERLGVIYARMARDARRVAQLERKRDEAAKRLRGTT